MEKYYTFESAEVFDIIFTFKKSSWLSRIIWWLSRSGESPQMVSHVLCYYGNNMFLEIDTRGVVLAKGYSLKRKNYVVHLGKCIVELDKGMMHRYANAKIGTVNYDFSRLFVLLFEKIFKINRVFDFTKSAMVCSEFVTNLYIQGGIHLSPFRPEDTTPFDIIQSDKLKVVTL